MVTMEEHVVVKDLKNTLIVKSCICWFYQSFNVSKCTELSM